MKSAMSWAASAWPAAVQWLSPPRRYKRSRPAARKDGNRFRQGIPCRDAMSSTAEVSAVRWYSGYLSGSTCP